MKKHIIAAGMAVLMALAANAQFGQWQSQNTTLQFLPGKIVVLRGGDGVEAFSSINKQNPAFLDEYDPVTLNQVNPLVSVELPTNNGPASLWFNASAGSEGQGLARSIDRRYILMTGYTSPIDRSKNGGPPSTYDFNRGFGIVDAFTNLDVVYSDPEFWFGGIGFGNITQDNPRGIASFDGTNFWGSGTVALTGAGSFIESGCQFYSSDPNDTELLGFPKSYCPILNSAYDLKIRNNTLFALAKAKDGYVNGLYTFSRVDDAVYGLPDPLPWLPDNGVTHGIDTTNLYCNFGSAYKSVVSFDMDNSNSIIYIADQALGIAKFVKTSGVWVQAYLFNTNNLGTPVGIGCFSLAADFTYSTTNYPVIYACTMESGDGLNVDSNRLVRIVDTGNPGTTAVVAQTLAHAQNFNEDFRGIAFAPDLTPLITSQPVGYSTVTNVTFQFTVGVSTAYPVTYQWQENGADIGDDSNITGSSSNVLTFALTSLTNSGNYSVVITNQYGSVTSSIANLAVASVPILPSTNAVLRQTNYIGDNAAFFIMPTNGTQPLTYQWYIGATALADGDDVNGSGYMGSQTSTLTIKNVQLADAATYFEVVGNAAGTITNKVIITVRYLAPIIPGGSQPTSIVMLQGQTNGLSVFSRGTAPLAYQWYKGKTAPVTALADAGEFSGSATSALTVNGAVVGDTTNYFCVITNIAGSATSQVASVSVIVPEALSFLAYSNQVYNQNFDSLPNPLSLPVNTHGGSATIIGQVGSAQGTVYWPANPYDFAYPLYTNITAGASGGLGLSSTMSGWYGECDLIQTPVPGGLIGAHDGSQTTGGVISFGNLNASNTNRALGLIATSSSGSTHFGLKLVNTSGQTLNYINLSYVGEYWKLGSHAKALDFGYAVDPVGNNATLSPDVITVATNNLVPDLSIAAGDFPLAAAGANNGLLAANQTNLAVVNLPLNSAWLSEKTLWLVWSIGDSSGSGQGYGIDNLSFAASVAPITAPTLGGVAYSGGAAGTGLKLGFADAPGASGQFTIWSTTNLTLPFSQWLNLGHPAEVTSGNYQFTDVQATNKPARFYKVTSP